MTPTPHKIEICFRNGDVTFVYSALDAVGIHDFLDRNIGEEYKILQFSLTPELEGPMTSLYTDDIRSISDAIDA